MFLSLKGSLVTKLTMAQDLHIEWLSPALRGPFADWFSYEELPLGPCGPCLALLCSTR